MQLHHHKVCVKIWLNNLDHDDTKFLDPITIVLYCYRETLISTFTISEAHKLSENECIEDDECVMVMV